MQFVESKSADRVDPPTPVLLEVRQEGAWKAWEIPFSPSGGGVMGEKTDYFSFKYTAITSDKLTHNLQLVLDFLEGLWDQKSLRYPWKRD